MFYFILENWVSCITTSLNVCSSFVSSNIFVDKHDFAPNKGLLALLLLGIPGGICFCCRKRICKSCRTSKSDTQTGQSNTEPVSIPFSNTVTDPVGPVGPGDPGQVK